MTPIEQQRELVATGYDSISDDIPAGESADYKVVINLEPGYDTSSLEYSFIGKASCPRKIQCPN
jgi:hypothetical protein